MHQSCPACFHDDSQVTALPSWLYLSHHVLNKYHFVMYIHLTETNKYWKLSSLFPSYTLAFHYIAAWDTMYTYKSASLFPVLTAQLNLQFFWRIFYQVAERIAQCVWGLEGANLNTTFNYSIATTFCNQHLTHNSKLKRKLAYIQLEKQKKKERKRKEKKTKTQETLC